MGTSNHHNLRNAGDWKMKKMYWYDWLLVVFVSAACIFIFTTMIYTLSTLYSSGAFSLERTIKHSLGENELFCNSLVIAENKGVGFIKYDCANTHSFAKAFNKCNGQYLVFAERVDGKWVVDPNSKNILWHI